MEIPQSHMVVKATCCHSVTFGLHDARGNSFGMTIQCSEFADRNAHLKPRLTAVILLIFLGLFLGFLTRLVFFLAGLDIIELGRTYHLLYIIYKEGNQ